MVAASTFNPPAKVSTNERLSIWSLLVKTCRAPITTARQYFCVRKNLRRYRSSQVRFTNLDGIVGTVLYSCLYPDGSNNSVPSGPYYSVPVEQLR